MNFERRECGRNSMKWIQGLGDWFAELAMRITKSKNLCELCNKNEYTHVELHPIEASLRVCDECAKVK